MRHSFAARDTVSLLHELPDVSTPPNRAAVWSLIGRTPLVRVRALEERRGIELYVKLESFNPGGSVKDRAAAAIIRDGLESGALGPHHTILDSTSGNTGIAYAMLGAALGYRVELCVPGNVSTERKRLLQAYGARITWTSALEGSDGAIREARHLHRANPGKYFYADQYNNPANWRAHYETTGLEILEQTNRRVTHFVAGLGTSGTFVGTGRRLREDKPEIGLISVQPDSPLHGLEGLKHMESAIVPGIYDASLADRDLRVRTEDAWEMVRRLARDAGLFVGPSGAAALVVAVRVAATIDRGVIVAIAPDGGERYLSDPMLDGSRA
jgi:S-sulfo-L-cysteine synthase (O-acetyl-L-serine-dependent)